jgi:Xaa-Pro aminopeptidase
MRHAGRHERLQRSLEERGLDAVILVGPIYAMYLTGYGRYLSSNAIAVVVSGGRRTLVVPRYELPAANEEADADEVVAYGDDDVLDFDPLPSLLKVCLEGATGRLAVAGAAIASAVSIDGLMRELRQIKDPDELERLRLSYRISLNAQARVEALAASGASEIELFSEAQSVAQREAGAPVEFAAGVSIGDNSAAVAPPVHVPGRRCPEYGDPVLADIALRHRGYWGDTTRTSVVGKNGEVEDVRARLGQILRESATALAPGTPAAEVFARTRRAIHSAFPEGRFPHHAGHAIGLEVAEEPQLIPAAQTRLEAGMVFALEPGVYFPGRFGARREDMFIVTDDGGVPLDEAALASLP